MCSPMVWEKQWGIFGVGRAVATVAQKKNAKRINGPFLLAFFGAEKAPKSSAVSTVRKYANQLIPPFFSVE